MPNAGIMASGFYVSPAVDVLLENFTSVSEWVGTISSVAGGRSGNMGQVGGSSVATFTLPAINEDPTITIGFAYKVSSIAAARTFLQLLSDATGTNHETFQVNTDGSIVAKLGGTGGTTLGITAAGLVAINTWNYIETQVFLHDATGTFRMRVNGTELINVSSVDTRNAGTKDVFDSIKLLGGGSGATSNFDDLYITVGAGAPFKGSITIP